MTAGFHYQPGSAVAVVHEQIAVLLAADPVDPVVDRVSALVLAGAGVDDVLDALVVSGLKSLVDFGAFEVRPDGVRLVVRGQVSGSVGAQPRLVAERTMWQDTWQPGQTSAGLAVSTSAPGPSLPLRSGVVLAAVVRYDESVAAPVAVPVAGPAEVAEPAVVSPVEPVVEPTVEPAADVEAPAPVDPPVEAVVEPAEAAVEPVTEAIAEAAPSVDFAHLFAATQHGPLVVPDEDDAGEAAGDEAADSAEEADEAEESVPDPSATMATPLTIPPEKLPGRSPSGTPAPLNEPDTAGKPATPAEPVTPPVTSGLITGIPWLAGGQQPTHSAGSAPVEVPRPSAAAVPPVTTVAASTPAPVRVEPKSEPVAPPVTPPEVAADRTVNRASLVGRSPVVTVTAIRCAQGHFNPPYAGKCRVCSAPMPPQHPTEIPRPTLGQLRLSTGGIVPLDRPAFLGRNPQVPSGYSAEQPNLVRLPDPDKDVSGQHLEVSLDYWNVLVRDLGSTNGTEVILPGEMPVVLRANDPVIIEPGTRVVLAGTISFIFEVVV